MEMTDKGKFENSIERDKRKFENTAQESTGTDRQKTIWKPTIRIHIARAVSIDTVHHIILKYCRFLNPFQFLLRSAAWSLNDNYNSNHKHGHPTKPEITKENKILTPFFHYLPLASDHFTISKRFT